jgi:hypothetical protein
MTSINQWINGCTLNSLSFLPSTYCHIRKQNVKFPYYQIVTGLPIFASFILIYRVRLGIIGRKKKKEKMIYNIQYNNVQKRNEGYAIVSMLRVAIHFTHMGNYVCNFDSPDIISRKRMISSHLNQKRCLSIIITCSLSDKFSL